ncbi:IS5-like element ISVch5 family transposase [Pseudomaricurvus hydrocarbonicus]
MLRIHVMQLMYTLSDPAMEDALYEIESMHRFSGLRMSDNLPDETTILNFRHFLEKPKFGQRLFDIIQGHQASQGLKLQEGSIVDATIIAALSSTKNEKGERDAEMHQVKKGNAWHFGMKMHVAVDESLGLIHSLTTTPANVDDITQVDQLLHGHEKRIWGDAGYQGSDKREEHKDRNIEWQIATRPGKRSTPAKSDPMSQAEKIKASVRAKVEYCFHRMKCQFGHSKVRYRGLAKNSNRLYLLAGFANLLRAEPYMMP